MTVTDPTWFVQDLNVRNAVRAVLAQLGTVNGTQIRLEYINVQMELLKIVEESTKDDDDATRRLSDKTGHVQADYQISIPWGVDILNGTSREGYTAMIASNLGKVELDDMTELLMQAIAERAGGWAYIVSVTGMSSVNVTHPNGEENTYAWEPPTPLPLAIASYGVRVMVPSSFSLAVTALAIAVQHR